MRCARSTESIRCETREEYDRAVAFHTARLRQEHGSIQVFSRSLKDTFTCIRPPGSSKPKLMIYLVRPGTKPYKPGSIAP